MTDQTHDGLPSASLTWCLRVICVLAIVISGYLAWTALKQSDVIGCGNGQIWDCGHVLHSRWSKWLGIPVSIPALLMYVATLCALIVCRTGDNPVRARFAWGLITVFGLSAGIAAVWFIALQVFVIGSFCLYCMGVHTCGIMMSALILRRRPLGKNMTSALSGLSVAAAAVLVAGQLLSPQAPTYAIERYDDVETVDDGEVFALDAEEADANEFLFAPTEGVFGSPVMESGGDETQGKNQDAAVPSDESLDVTQIERAAAVVVNSTQAPVPSFSPAPDSENVAGAAKKGSTPSPSPSPLEPPKKLVDVLGGRAQLNVRHWPLIGDLQADYVLVELFDYTCPHCRKMNEHIKAVRERYNDRLAVVTLPVPLSRECNEAIADTKTRHRDACELARLAIAVWRLDPAAFQGYHEWLFEPAHGRTAAEASARAAQLVGRAELNAELAKPIVNQFIAKHVELYKRAGSGTIPKLMFPKVTVTGEMNSVDALNNVLKRELNIR